MQMPGRLLQHDIHLLVLLRPYGVQILHTDAGGADIDHKKTYLPALVFEKAFRRTFQ